MKVNAVAGLRGGGAARPGLRFQGAKVPLLVAVPAAGGAGEGVRAGEVTDGG